MRKQKKDYREVFDVISKDEARIALATNMIKIVGNILRIMGEKDVNQRELGLRINSEESHVSYMLKHIECKNGITLNVLSRISLALEVSLPDLVK